jgi:hypothetical protein
VKHNLLTLREKEKLKAGEHSEQNKIFRTYKNEAGNSGFTKEGTSLFIPVN